MRRSVHCGASLALMPVREEAIPATGEATSRVNSRERWTFGGGSGNDGIGDLLGGREHRTVSQNAQQDRRRG